MQPNRIERIKEHLLKMPEDSFLKHALALEYIKLGDHAEAVRLFEELLSKDPDYVGSYYHWGKTLEQLGNPKQAIAVYEKGILIARKLNEQHACQELMAAYDELI